MKLLERIRYKSFWFTDFLKGRVIKSHFEEIKYILENFQDTESIQMRENYLNNILNHAIKTVPYYKNSNNYNSITDFPVVNKLILRKELDDFISIKFTNKPGYKVSTSGSTGTPLHVFMDIGKRNRNTADTLYFGEKAGYKIGHRLFYMKVWGSMFTKTAWYSFLQNIKTINVRDVKDNHIQDLISKIKKGNSTNAFIGYTSYFKEICKYLESVNAPAFRIDISSMIAIAEPLGLPIKKAVKKFFNFDILSRYSNMENGILSQQIKNAGQSYHINWASYFIEILDLDEDVPVSYGTLGRVVVTDLFNYHMPMIRYDTGDLAIMNVDKNFFNGAPSFSKVEGRRMDTIYDTQGNVMTTVVYELEYFPEFKQSQLIQKGEKTYVVKINMDGIFTQEEKMIDILQNFLGSNAIIEIEYVDEIPQLSSGKMKLSLNTYKS